MAGERGTNGPFTFDPTTFVGPELRYDHAHGWLRADSRYSASAPAAERSIALIAQWQPGTMNVRASRTSSTGLTKHCGSGTLSDVGQLRQRELRRGRGRAEHATLQSERRIVGA